MPKPPHSLKQGAVQLHFGGLLLSHTHCSAAFCLCYILVAAFSLLPFGSAALLLCSLFGVLLALGLL